MKCYYNKIRYIIILIVFVSCNLSLKRPLVLSDKRLKTNPVQVLAILDSLENAGGLNKEEQLHLVWNRALAHQALEMSMTEDDQLLDAIAYYRKDADKQVDSYLLEYTYRKGDTDILPLMCWLLDKGNRGHYSTVGCPDLCSQNFYSKEDRSSRRTGYCSLY